MIRTTPALSRRVASPAGPVTRDSAEFDGATAGDTFAGTSSWRQVELSPGAVALLNAIATIAPATTDPWARFPPVLQAEDVAEILGMKVGSAREAARRGNVPMTRRLGRYVVDQTVFRRWLAGYDVWAEGLVPTVRAGGV